MTARQYFESRSSRPLIRQAGHRKIQRGFYTETMATLTTPRKTTDAEHVYHAINHAGLLTREDVVKIEAEIAAILAPAAPAAAPALPGKMSLLAMILQPVKAFWDDISGPAMTAHDRDARDLAEARNHNYTGFAGY